LGETASFEALLLRFVVPTIQMKDSDPPSLLRARRSGSSAQKETIMCVKIHTAIQNPIMLGAYFYFLTPRGELYVTEIGDYLLLTDERITSVSIEAREYLCLFGTTLLQVTSTFAQDYLDKTLGDYKLAFKLFLFDLYVWFTIHDLHQQQRLSQLII
jgi:hypothetical protein